MPPPKEKPFGFRSAPIRGSVRRNLFGKMGQNETAKLNEWLDQKDEEQARAKSEKYGFDFVHCKQINGVLSDYEIVVESEKKVPLFYHARTVVKRKRQSLTELREEELEEASVSSSSDSRESLIVGPVTRSAAKRREGEKKTLKQAKMTRYLHVRKRRSMDTNTSGEMSSPAVKKKRIESDAPASPYTYVSHEEEIEFPDLPTKSANSSPVKKRSHSSTPGTPSAVRSLHLREASSV